MYFNNNNTPVLLSYRHHRTGCKKIFIHTLFFQDPSQQHPTRPTFTNENFSGGFGVSFGGEMADIGIKKTPPLKVEEGTHKAKFANSAAAMESILRSVTRLETS